MRCDVISALPLTRLRMLSCVPILTLLISSGCSDESGGSAAGPPTTSITSGSVTKGPVTGGTARVFELLKEGVGEQVGDGPVKRGSFSADLGDFEGSVLVEVADGSYTEEADGTSVSLADFPGVPMRSVVAGVEMLTDTKVNVTPFTTIATAIVLDGGNRCQDPDVNTLIADGLMRTVRFFLGDLDADFEINLLEVAPADLTAGIDDPCSDAALLGAWNAGLSELGFDHGVPALDVLGALLEDMGDGIFDGFDAEGFQIEIAGAPIGRDLATAQLADAIERFLGSEANRSGIELSDLLPGGGAACLGADIDALRNLGENAALYGPAAVVFPAGQDEGPFRGGDVFEVRVDFIELFGAAQGTLTLPLDPSQMQADCDAFQPGAIPAERFDAFCDSASGTVTVTIAPGPPISGCGELFTATILAIGDASPAQIALGDVDLRTAANESIEVNNLASTERTLIANDSPIALITGPGSRLIPALSEFVLDGSISIDANADSLSFEWQDLSGGLLTIADPTGPSTTVTAHNVMLNTEATIRLSVDDGRSVDSTGTAEFTVTIVPENDAPILHVEVTPGTEVDEQTQVVLDAFGSIDPNGNGLRFEWAQTAGLPVEDLSGENPWLLIFRAPTLVQDETLTFVVTVTDDHLLEPLTKTQEVVITVRNLSDPPSAVVAPVGSVPELTQVTLDGSDSSDPNPGDRDLLSFQWTQTAGTLVALSGATGDVATFTAPPALDTLTFELKVTDPGGLTATAVGVVTVRVSVPVAAAGTDRSVSEGTPGVTLDGSHSFDPDGGALAFRWTQTGAPVVPLAGANTPRPTFGAPSLAPDASDLVLTFELEVTDPDGLTDRDQVKVMVTRNNDAPSAVVAPVGPVSELTRVTLDGSDSSDPNPGDRDLLSFQWNQTGGTPVILNAQGSLNRQVTFTAPAAPDTLTFELKVTDPGGLATTAVVAVPVVAAGTDLAVSEGTPGVTLDGSQSFDPGGGALEFR